MKNLAKIFMAVVLLAGITSCVQDTTVDEGFFQPTTEITISVEDANRTALGAKTDEGTYPVYWSNGDKVSINGIESSALAVEGESQLVKGLFEFTGDLVTPYKASYPATEAAGQVLFAAQQSYVAGTFSQGAAAMYGESETLAIQMQHAAGVLQFPIKAEEGAEVVLKKVVVTNPNGKLAGLYNAALVEGELTLTPDASAINTISYNCGDLALSTEPVKLHIAVPAGEYEELRVSLVSADNQIMNFKVTAVGEKRVKAGIVREFNKTTHITFSGNDASFQITDSESLMEFAEMCANGAFAYSNAKVMNNFTFDSATYTWAPVTGFVDGIEFDGNNCTITGLPDALFATAVGTIRNLTLDSTIEKGVTTKAGFGIFANHFQGEINNCTAKGSFAVTSTTQDWTAVAGFVGWATGAITFVDATNEAAISVDNAPKRTYIAGLLGSNYPNKALAANNPMTFTRCTNTGAITSKENGSNRRGMGGLVGCHYTAEPTNVMTFTNCSNTGAITNNTVASDHHIAGIVGSAMGYVVMDETTNSGPIAVTGTQTATSNNYSLGGLSGYQTQPIIMTDCSNLATGTINIGTAPGGVRIGGLVAYLECLSTDCAFGNCTNLANLNPTGTYTRLLMGGCIGHSRSNITPAEGYTVSCSNSGTITDGSTVTTYFCVGGVIGYCCNGVKGIRNTGAVTYAGKVTTGQAAGTSKNTLDAAKSCYLGGAIAWYGDTGSTITTLTSIEDVENTANVTITPQDNSLIGDACIGGTIGLAYKASVKDVHFKKAQGATVAPKVQYTGLKFHHNTGGNGNNHIIATGGAIGAVVSALDGSNIEDCSNEGTIYLNSSDYQGSHNVTYGGVVAYVRVGAHGKISGCTNSGTWEAAADNFGSRKSMCYGGVVGNPNCNVEDCTNNGSIIYREKSSTTVYNSSYYSNCMGGVVGNLGGGIVSGCTNTGSITAEANSLAPQTNGYDGFGGIVGNNGSNTEIAVEECTDQGSITINTNSGVLATRITIGGIIGRLTYATKKNYIVKDCIAQGDINTPALAQVGLVTGETYTKAAGACAAAEGFYPVMGCKIDGAIVNANVDIDDVKDDNFVNVIYSDTPTVDTWVPVVGDDGVTRYHGNYGVATAGGDSSGDLG